MLVCSAVLTLSGHGADGAEAKRNRDATLPDEVMAAVVTIQEDQGSGTGFVAKFRGNLVIVTNQHVLGNNRRLTIKGNRGLQQKGSKFAAGSDADIAMIQLDMPRPD